MSLQSLPAELISHIFSFLPELSPIPSSVQARTITIGPNTSLTPAVCRASHALRREALPLYARHAPFVIQMDDGHRISAFLDALGNEGVRYLQSLQLSQHWRLSQPTRWQGHVGFYVKLSWVGGGGGEVTAGSSGGEWRCATGTYPFANDVRGMRLESVELLRRIVEQRLQLPRHEGGDARRGLRRSDVEFVVQAMEIVARHPIEAFDIEQSEQERRARRKVWESMYVELGRMGGGGGDSHGSGEATDQDSSSSRFFTPY